MAKTYEKPTLRELGSVEEMTEQTFNKVGTTSDAFTVITNGIVIGSLITSP
jgi:hypothetical protein